MIKLYIYRDHITLIPFQAPPMYVNMPLASVVLGTIFLEIAVHRKRAETET